MEGKDEYEYSFCEDNKVVNGDVILEDNRLFVGLYILGKTFLKYYLYEDDGINLIDYNFDDKDGFTAGNKTKYTRKVVTNYIMRYDGKKSDAEIIAYLVFVSYKPIENDINNDEWHNFYDQLPDRIKALMLMYQV